MRRLGIKVIAGAKKEGVRKISETDYIIKVSTAPEKGRANRRVIELLSEKLGIKRKNIRIIKGECRKRKIIELI